MQRINYIAVPFDSNSEKKGASLAPHLLHDYLRGRFSDIEYAAKFKGKNFSEIEKFANELPQTCKKPFFIGGDHSVTLPLFKALSKKHKKLDFIYLDAHFDADKLGKIFNSSFVNYIYEFSKPKILNIGSRPKCQKEKPSFIDSIPSMEFSENLLEKKLYSFKKSIYLSIDADVFEPAIFPGVSHQEAFGMASRDFYNALKIIFRQCNIVAVDLVEFNPSVEKKQSIENFASIAKLVENFWENQGC